MPYKKVASKKISMFCFCDFIVSPEFNLFMFVIQAESPSFCVLQQLRGSLFLHNWCQATKARTFRMKYSSIISISITQLLSIMLFYNSYHSTPNHFVWENSYCNEFRNLLNLIIEWFLWTNVKIVAQLVKENCAIGHHYTPVASLCSSCLFSLHERFIIITLSKKVTKNISRSSCLIRHRFSCYYPNSLL